MQLKNTYLRMLGSLALMMSMVATSAQAQEYPSRPIKLVAPFAPGAASDALARAIAENLRAELKQTVIVENRGGAGGTIGVGSVVASAPDGYTMVLGGTGSLVFAEGAYKLNYSLQKDLRPVAMIASAQSAIVVRSSLGVNSLQELVQRAKKSPSLTYGSPGVGSILHLAGVMFEKITGTTLVHVPYKGLAPALTDLQGGNIDVVFANITSLGPFLQSGKVKALAVIDDRASPQLPGIPTTAAVGMPDMVMDTWYGLMIPARVPDQIAKTLETAVASAVKRPEFIKAMNAQGFDVVSDTSSAHFARVLKRDSDQWIPMIKKLDLQMQ